MRRPESGVCSRGGVLRSLPLSYWGHGVRRRWRNSEWKATRIMSAFFIWSPTDWTIHHLSGFWLTQAASKKVSTGTPRVASQELANRAVQTGTKAKAAGMAIHGLH